MSHKGGQHDDKAGQGNKVPVWNGHPETFFHFTQEVKWYLAGTKSSERSYAAARLIRQLLESDYPALRSLMYRLDPMEFTSEDATSKLIKFLESSPMNKQPIPDAGAKLSAYYRKLARRSGETIPQFLIREETLHDEMWRSLQRLLREKELDFERYDVTVPELKEFCGIGADASVYYGGLTEEESTRTQTPPAGSRQASEQDDEELRSADASLPSAPGAPPTRGKPLDLIQRLMDKGLVPLAALDIIRGWMVLEMASENDTEKTLVKASAQNKLGYDSVRQALLTLHEDRGKGYGSPHRGQRFGAGKASGKYGVMYSVDEESADWHDDTYGEWGSDPWEAEWAYWMPTEEYHSGQDNYWAEPDAPGDDQTTENAEGSQDPQVEEAMQAMAKLREEEKELQAYMADAQRNLDQARKAVAAAKRDRGWTSTLPTSSKGPPRPTSTWMHQGKGKSSNLGAMYFNKGGKSGYYPDYAKGKKGSGKTKGKFNQWMVEPAYEVMTMDVLEADGCPVQSGTPAELLQAAADATIHPTETVMDTGATVSAGGQDAVNALLTSLAQARPDMNVTIVQQDRPYFRFGSGAWGQALYKVCIAVPGHSFKLQFYALPSPGVPVLLGMRELQQLGVIINLQNSKALVLGKPWSLRVNSKQQILFDMTAIFAKIPTQPRSNISYRTPSANACMMTAIEPNVVPHQSGSACDDRDGYTLCPLQIGESQQLHQAEATVAEPTCPSGFFTDQGLQDHLGVNSDEFSFLVGDSESSRDASSFPLADFFGNGGPILNGERGRSDQAGHPGHRPRGHPRGVGQCPVQHEGASQGEEDGVGRAGLHEDHEGGAGGPQNVGDPVAVFRDTHGSGRGQQVRILDSVHAVRREAFVCPTRASPCKLSSQRASSTCHCCSGATTHEGSEAIDYGGQVRAQPDQDHRAGACVNRGQANGCQSESQGIPEGPRRARQGDGQEEGGCPRDRGIRGVRGVDQRHGDGQHAGPGSCSEEAGVRIEAAGGEGLEDHRVLSPATLKGIERSLHSSVFDGPAQSLVAVHKQADPVRLWELCCGPQSNLTAEVDKHGFQAERISLHTGLDLEKQQHAQQLISSIPVKRPNKVWVAPRCNPWTNQQKRNQSTPAQVELLRRLRYRSRKQIRHVIQIFKAVLDYDSCNDVYFEWPTSARQGWDLPEWGQFQAWLWKHHQRKVFFCRIDGCMVGAQNEQGVPIRKQWTIMTTDKHFHDHAAVTCDGTHDHAPMCVAGNLVEKSGYYPPKFARRIVQVWKGAWHQSSDASILRDLHVLQHDFESMLPVTSDTTMPMSSKKRAASREPSRSTQHAQEQMSDAPPGPALPAQSAGGTEPSMSSDPALEDFGVPAAERQKGIALLHRLHKAAGHPSNKALARLCRDRKLPKWLVEEAERLVCQACVDAERGGHGVLHKSLGQQPHPWQMVGVDVLEVAFPAQQCKSRFLLMTCVAMRFISIVHLWSGKFSETGTDSGEKLINAFCEGWLLHRPRPEWLVVDSQSSLRFGLFPEFLEHAGIGLTVVPGEAHWMHGRTEAMVQVAKRTMRRMRNESPDLAPPVLAALVVSAHNNSDKIMGYTPTQWAYGYDPNRDLDHDDPLYANKDCMPGPKMFQDLVRMRDRAEQINREERAREAYTRLMNAAPRALIDYR